MKNMYPYSSYVMKNMYNEYVSNVSVYENPK